MDCAPAQGGGGLLEGDKGAKGGGLVFSGEVVEMNRVVAGGGLV